MSRVKPLGLINYLLGSTTHAYRDECINPIRLL